jgi:hypothetical protein
MNVKRRFNSLRHKAISLLAKTTGYKFTHKTCEEVKRVEKFVISRCHTVTKKLTQAYESDMKTLLLIHEAEQKFTGAFKRMCDSNVVRHRDPDPAPYRMAAFVKKKKQITKRWFEIDLSNEIAETLQDSFLNGSA